MKLADNPFFVLAVGCDATRMEIEREAQKLLGMLELGFAAAATYDTPIGPQARTQEAVRAAVAVLRDPYQRLVAEFWARHAPTKIKTCTCTSTCTCTCTRNEADAPVAVVTRRRLGWP